MMLNYGTIEHQPLVLSAMPLGPKPFALLRERGAVGLNRDNVTLTQQKHLIILM